jgi:hypothetical protein
VPHAAERGITRHARRDGGRRAGAVARVPGRYVSGVMRGGSTSITRICALRAG